MSGDDKDLTPEEKAMRKAMQEADKKIAEIKKKMDELPKDRPPALRLNPPGFGNSGSNNSGNQKLEYQRQIDEVKTKTAEQVTEIYKDRPTNDQLKAFRTVDNWTNPLTKENVKERDLFTESQERIVKAGNNKTVDKDSADKKPAPTKEGKPAADKEEPKGFTGSKQETVRDGAIASADNYNVTKFGSQYTYFNPGVGGGGNSQPKSPSKPKGPDIDR